jgi:hypothetical protein
MALWKSVGNGHLEGVSQVADLDVSLHACSPQLPNIFVFLSSLPQASKLVVRTAQSLKDVPPDGSPIAFGQVCSL